MWTLIFGGIVLGTVLSIVYLASRFARFNVIRKKAKERKGIRFLLGLVPVVLILLAVGLALGAINAMVTMMHLMVFWLLCDGMSRLVEKKRNAEFSRYYAGIAAMAVTDRKSVV